MNTIPALEMKGWRASASDCTGNQIVVKYQNDSSETFWRRLCNQCGVATDLKQFGKTPAESINEALQHSSNSDFNARYKAILDAIKASQK